MTWHLYRLVYRLESPLHLGWRKVGNLQRTRPYVSGRVWWGVATSLLTECLGRFDYRAVGELVREHLVFGYFFPAEDPGQPLIPRWERGGLLYGTIRAGDFEARFLGSLASTAIDHGVGGAEEGSLHEVEYLSPATEDGRPVYLVGHLFARESPAVSAADGEVLVQGQPLFGGTLARVQVGGERRSGFGRLRLEAAEPGKPSDLFGLEVEVSGGHPRLRVPAGRPLAAHARVDGLHATGPVEPLVSREWDEVSGPGRSLQLVGVCYAPGSILEVDSDFSIGQYGIWSSLPDWDGAAG